MEGDGEGTGAGQLVPPDAVPVQAQSAARLPGAFALALGLPRGGSKQTRPSLRRRWLRRCQAMRAATTKLQVHHRRAAIPPSAWRARTPLAYAEVAISQTTERHATRVTTTGAGTGTLPRLSLLPKGIGDSDVIESTRAAHAYQTAAPPPRARRGWRGVSRELTRAVGTHASSDLKRSLEGAHDETVLTRTRVDAVGGLRALASSTFRGPAQVVAVMMTAALLAA